MGQKSYAILVSNTAVLVVHKGVRILLDGLYKDLGKNFTDLPEWAWKQMKQGKGELANVDYLLFSHSHYDHYYSPYFFEYMEKNEIKGLFLPPVDDTSGLAEAEAEYASKLLRLDENFEVVLDDEVTMKNFTVRHIDKQFYDIPNQCIRLDVAGTKLTFFSDADYHEEAFLEAKDFQCDIAFVTPIFYNSSKGRRILRDILGVRKVVIYHLPSPDDDRFLYYKMAERDAQKYAQPDEEVIVWNETGQAIALDE